MSKPHKDLPAGSQPWANEVDAAMKRIAELEAIVRRLTENAGIDMSNPKRGINTGDTPNAGSPVGQKVSSLADVDTYNVLDGQVLSWTGQGQKWMPVTPLGSPWKLATEEEHLYGDLDSDSDYYSTQVMGLYDRYPEGVDYNTGGTGDSYGLVGTSTTSAFLHGAQRFWGGPTRAHGTIYAGPYYCQMAVKWIDEISGTWDDWGQIGIDRDDVYLSTPMGEPSQHYGGSTQRDGSIYLSTNWFYVPQVNGVQNAYWNINYPRRPVAVGYTPTAGAHVYDMTLKKPIWWNGTAWVDAMGNAIPAPLY